jgi:prepilin-type N-terminal cleavage/methylation domain-containing protein
MGSAQHTRGFTLTELAVVLAIVGLLLGAMMITFSTQVDQRNHSETQRNLDEAKELLLAFAIVNGRLPCPATCTNPPACTTGSAGDENPAGGGACSTYTQGFLPARTIGFQPTNAKGFAIDAWGNPIRYAVASTVQTGSGCPAVTATNPPSALTTYWSPPFTSATATGVTNASTFLKANGIACSPDSGDLVVCSAAPAGTSCAVGQSVTNQNTVVAVVLSTGKNGAQGTGGTNEAENQDGDNVFVYRPPDPSTASGGEYDDLTAWIPVGLLYERLISAGVLP